MASYLQKLRRQSKQFIPQTEKKEETPKIQDAPAVQKAPPAPAQTQESTSSKEPASAAPPLAPTVTEPSEEPSAEPVLDAEDQIFLERLAAIASEPEGDAPPLPSRPTAVVDDAGEMRVGKDAQEALMDGADKIALPMSPGEATEATTAKGKEKATGEGLGRKKSVMSYFSPVMDRFKSKDKASPTQDKTEKLSEKERKTMADDLQSAALAAKASELDEQKKEDKELTDILDQLNMSAVNNRVFSFSKESEELLNKFTQVLKDIVNGVPTAYNDLEKLFTEYDTQLKKMYGGLPPFLQNMVKSLPAKLTATLGPELLAANAEKPGFDAKAAGAASGSKSKRSKIPSIPSLKSIISAQGAVATALRSIVNFLKFRFPALAGGTNLIMSLAVFLLLFVFWYCHKRGRETRLEKERLAAEDAESGRVSSASSVNEADTDSIFGEMPKRKPVGSGTASPNPATATAATTTTEQPQQPLIIGPAGEQASVDDMPSVSHLPDPKEGSVPEMKK